nr:hypothetical protein [uncultured Roseovarius sp.]
MNKIERPKKLSDEICTAILKGVRFSPHCAQTDLRTDGIHSIGLGGLGYGYWRSPKIMELNKKVRIFRELTQAELSYNEVEEFVSSYLEKFVNPVIAGRFDLQIGDGCLLERLEREEVERLKQCFFEYVAVYVSEKQFWLPLGSVEVEAYKGKVFTILSKQEFESIWAGQAVESLGVRQQKNALSFLGVKARNRTRALEKSSAIIGSLMLCMYSGTQFSHTMGETVSDIFEIGDRTIMSTTPPHVPALSTPIILTSSDRVWLDKVDEFLEDEFNNRKLIRALQWMRSSWFLSGAERFTTICQAVDAVTPSKFKTMRAKCGWIVSALSADLSTDAAEILFKSLRSDVVHGDAPALIESSNYLTFLEKYDVEPMHATFEIVRHILIQSFLPEMIVRSNPILGYPNTLGRKNEIYARYGMEYIPPSGFDFSVLRTAEK